jgi:hypothetical protein
MDVIYVRTNRHNYSEIPKWIFSHRFSGVTVKPNSKRLRWWRTTFRNAWFLDFEYGMMDEVEKPRNPQ